MLNTRTPTSLSVEKTKERKLFGEIFKRIIEKKWASSLRNGLRREWTLVNGCELALASESQAVALGYGKQDLAK